MKQKNCSFRILPPAPDKCQVCAVKHEPEQPHNKNSIFYQIYFVNDPVNNGRSATWKDAMAHCTDEVKKRWIEELSKQGVIV